MTDGVVGRVLLDDAERNVKNRDTRTLCKERERREDRYWG